MFDKIARFMGVDVDTKACVYCGCDVSKDDSIASYMEFQSDIDYACANPYNGVSLTLDGFYSTMWINAHIPPRNTHADIYPLCMDCTSHLLDGETYIPFNALIPFEDAWDSLP